jgi:hypothetical protein
LIGTMTAVGSPFSLDAIWISVLATGSVYSLQNQACPWRYPTSSPGRP